MRKLTLLFLFIAIANICIAQDTGEDKLGTWYEITSSNRVSDNISLSGSFTNWNYELIENQHLYLGLFFVNYHLSKNVSVSLGYGRGNIDSSFEDSGIPNTKENRSMEQLFVKHKSHNISWSHRFRLEQRFLDYPDKSITKHRIRYRFKGSLPINKTLFVVAYDEIHFNLNEFDFQQNRVYTGLGYKLNNNIDVQLGYARHSFKTKSFNRLSLQVNLKYDFRKNK